MTTKRPSPLTSFAKDSRLSGRPAAGVAVGVGEGVGVGTAGMVVEVTCRMTESGVGVSVWACEVAARAPRSRKSATADAEPARDRRKACFTKSPPRWSIKSADE
jgi:hypothetical protein